MILDASNVDDGGSKRKDDIRNEDADPSSTTLSDQEADKATSLRCVCVGVVLYILITTTNNDHPSYESDYMVVLHLVADIIKLIASLVFFAFVCRHCYRSGNRQA